LQYAQERLHRRMGITCARTGWSLDANPRAIMRSSRKRRWIPFQVRVIPLENAGIDQKCIYYNTFLQFLRGRRPDRGFTRVERSGNRVSRSRSLGIPNSARCGHQAAKQRLRQASIDFKRVKSATACMEGREAYASDRQNETYVGCAGPAAAESATHPCCPKPAAPPKHGSTSAGCCIDSQPAALSFPSLADVRQVVRSAEAVPPHSPELCGPEFVVFPAEHKFLQFHELLI
jgi:hypothetical protein